MEENAQTLEWTSHPVRERPVSGVLVAGLLLSLSVAPFYLPTRYRIADDKVSIRSTFGRKEKSLKLFRRLAADRYGVLLSPFDRPSRLDRFHGLNLRFDSADRERVLEFLGCRLAENERES